MFCVFLHTGRQHATDLGNQERLRLGCRGAAAGAGVVSPRRLLRNVFAGIDGSLISFVFLLARPSVPLVPGTNGVFG
jgi:hypothetical protein